MSNGEPTEPKKKGWGACLLYAIILIVIAVVVIAIMYGGVVLIGLAIWPLLLYLIEGIQAGEAYGYAGMIILAFLAFISLAGAYRSRRYIVNLIDGFRDKD